MVDEQQLTPLMWAAKCGHAEAAELILSYGGRLGNNCNTKDLLLAEDLDGVTALHYAARGAHDGVLNAMLVLADVLDISLVNTANVDGSTALHWAARKNHLQTLRLLLRHGADRDQRNKWGAVALDNAVYAPRGAYGSIAILSRDAEQIRHALEDERVQKTIRSTEEEEVRSHSPVPSRSWP